jgi:prepilin-type N-terminal cleavage/methylation domain-containing protein
MTDAFRRLHQRLRRLRGADDAGMSLIEVLVSATIMSIVMAIATAGMLQMYKSFGSSELAQIGQAQMHNTFTKLDREIRYASYVSAPGKVGTTWYVEYKYLDGSTLKCIELALAGTGKLERRSWPVGDTTTATSVMVLASTVASVTTPASNPFSAADGTHFQGLRIRFKDTTASNAATDMTFTALNSADALTANPTAATRTDCTERRS